MDFNADFITKLKQQDHIAFNEFYLKTIDTFFRYINANYSLTKQDAEDVVADFYVKRREAIKHHDEKQSFS
jgi:DNA-directed RNA polymerase specialized sigma24 family protein